MNYHGLKPVVSGSNKGDSTSASLRAAFIPSLKRLGFFGKGDKNCHLAPGVLLPEAMLPGVRPYSARAFATKAPGMNEGDVQRNRETERLVNIYRHFTHSIRRRPFFVFQSRRYFRSSTIVAPQP